MLLVSKFRNIEINGLKLFFLISIVGRVVSESMFHSQSNSKGVAIRRLRVSLFLPSTLICSVTPSIFYIVAPTTGFDLELFLLSSESQLLSLIVTNSADPKP